MSEVNPYQAPKAPVDTGVDSSEDIEKVRTGQKTILWAIVLNIGGTLLNFAVPLLGVLAALAALVMSFVGIVRLGAGLGYSTAARVGLCILMFVPLVNLITLLIVNSRATSRLRDAGYKVGLMGASK